MLRCYRVAKEEIVQKPFHLHQVILSKKKVLNTDIVVAEKTILKIKLNIYIFFNTQFDCVSKTTTIAFFLHFEILIQ